MLLVERGVSCWCWASREIVDDSDGLPNPEQLFIPTHFIRLLLLKGRDA